MGESILAAGVVLLMATIVLQVVCNAFDINPLVVFETAQALFGPAITLNSLLDLQWHLLVLVGLLPAGLLWLRDAHVRVDFLYASWSERAQARVNLVGHLMFAAPFLWLALPASWDFMARAWRTDEGTRNGGLVDLWLIKAALPLGLGLLALAVMWESARLWKAAR